MCTYLTLNVDVAGSGKGPRGWTRLGRTTVYFDHPQHVPAEHTLNIDFWDAENASRVAVELTAESARAVAGVILDMLAAAPPELLGSSKPAASTA